MASIAQGADSVKMVPFRVVRERVPFRVTDRQIFTHMVDDRLVFDAKSAHSAVANHDAASVFFAGHMFRVLVSSWAMKLATPSAQQISRILGP
jgi:hypothetical protein